MIEQIKRKTKIKSIIAGILSVVLIVGVMVVYTRGQYQRVLDQTTDTIVTNTEYVANSIDSHIGHALNSIQVTSTGITHIMTKDVLEDPQSIISTFIDNTPFSSIEYIRKDGMNITSAGDPFDASNREYFIEGIKGKTGIWVNYTPKYSKEPLLNFYTPLYYEDKIVGVITGTLGGDNDIKPLLMNEYYNQPMVGLLLDEKNQIITSTSNYRVGITVDGMSSQFNSQYREAFLMAIDEANGTPLNIGGKYDNTVCVVNRVNSAGWKVLQVAPSTSIHGIISGSSKSGNIAVGIVFVIAISLFLFILFENRKISKLSIHKANVERDEQLSIMLSMADVYYSMHVIDLVGNSMFEYKGKNQVYDEVQKGLSATETMINIMKSTMTDEYIGYGLEFTDLTTLADRMRDKKVTYTELKGKNVGWIRLSFIALERDISNRPTKVICTTEIIDVEKKREQSLLYKSNTDELTGFYNRRAYAESIESIPRDGLVYVSMDVNGLKVINDTLGHDAGDELLRGASECMNQCFGSYGHVYRMGGDEFVALIYADDERLEKIKEDFENTTLLWKGVHVDSLNVSCGFVRNSEYPMATMEELSKYADQRMYKAKAEYYQRKGIDRRGQSVAHLALCALYSKILKINLTDDSYRIISMDMTEQTEERGYSNKISEWLHNFGTTGQVHPDDLESYLQQTDIEFLRSYFTQDKTSINIYYRRKTENSFKEVMMEMIPANDYKEDYQILFLYVKSIDK